MKKEQIHNKGLKRSSKEWIKRQINDQYVLKAKQEGYRSRASFKLLEIQNKFKIMNKDSVVVDLGAAPGGWSQVAAKICKKVIAVDLLDMDHLDNVEFIIGDFLEEKTIQKIVELLDGKKVDVILSDMSPNCCGIRKVDHLRISNLAEMVFDFAKVVLKEKRSIVIKTFQGIESSAFIAELKKQFKTVSYFKPKSSRKESTEIYIVARQND
ncbi:MAG: RlmE family RNA methyltransferase [Holosporales bacterium]|jgi:23S rRNA (uridine2552-2'-O)-methyltransferase|nr:RlmE family RNA methyltransferase [Holosporales bacterium]